jgi:hypothetical protein
MYYLEHDEWSPLATVDAKVDSSVQTEQKSISRQSKAKIDTAAVLVKPKKKSTPIKVVTKSSSNTTKKSKSKQRQPHTITWNIRYNQLLAYKRSQGHCLVPQNYATNPKLGLWVMAQRRQYKLLMSGKNSSLTQSRIELLKDIGFVFKVERRGPRGAYGSLQLLKNKMEYENVIVSHDDGSFDGCGERKKELVIVENFEKYMVEKSNVFSEEEIRVAWRQRFEIFQ